MRLENIKNLTEAGYVGNNSLYFIQAYDPDDGLLDIFAGPFKSKAEAKKFVKWMDHHDREMFGDRVDINNMPSYTINEMSSADAFIKEMEEHIEVFAN